MADEPRYSGRHRPEVGPPVEAASLSPELLLLGRYRLLERLTPMEPVMFRADDLLLRREVLVTFAMLDSDSAELIYGTPDSVGISRLRHPALATLLDIGHDPEVRESFVVSEHLSDTSLSQWVESRPITLDELQPILRQLAELLLTLLRSGFGHRALGPDLIRVAEPVDVGATGYRVQAGLFGLYGRDQSAPLAAEVAALAAIVRSASDAADLAVESVAAGAGAPGGPIADIAPRTDLAWREVLTRLVAVDGDANEANLLAETALRRFWGLTVTPGD